MKFSTLSAIIRGNWLLDKQLAEQHLPLVMRVMKGEHVDFGDELERESVARVLLPRKAGAVYSVSPYSDLSKLQDGSIVKLTMAGPVLKYGDACTYGSVEYTESVNRLRVSPNVAGVIIEIDSPGGQAAGTAMLADAINSLRAVKPVITFINDGFAGSAGAWIATAADEIYVSQETDQIGSIGVYTTIADVYSYYEQQGLKIRDVYAPQSTGKNLDYRSAIEGDDELLKSELSVLCARFIASVKENRGGRLTSDEWNTGLMYHAKDAIRIGLIDGVKSFENVVVRMDQLIKQKHSSNKINNNMAFTKTLTAAKTQAFAVVDGGFLLDEENLNNVEAALKQRDTSLAVANNSIATLNEQLQVSQSENASLTARIEKLEKSDATQPKEAPPAGDDKFKEKAAGSAFGNTPYDRMRYEQ